MSMLLTVLAALAVVIGMRAVGLLLVSAIMIVPVAAAQQLTRAFRTTAMIGVVVGELSAVLGLFSLARRAARHRDRHGGPAALGLCAALAPSPCGVVAPAVSPLRQPPLPMPNRSEHTHDDAPRHQRPGRAIHEAANGGARESSTSSNRLAARSRSTPSSPAAVTPWGSPPSTAPSPLSPRRARWTPC